MSDGRRSGPTWGWRLFWRFFWGERRSGFDRRAHQDTPFIPPGCGGDCNQGRRPCTCRPQIPQPVQREGAVAPEQVT